MIIVHDPRCAEYSADGHPEGPGRLLKTAEHLRRTHPEWRWRLPAPASDEAILRAHSSDYLAQLRDGGDAFDEDTPRYPDILAHAARAAGAAIDVAQLALSGERAFSLMRPPGHHATRDAAMGFCYLNSIAIAARDALARGLTRVSIWDFDGHHGNGTEDICRGDLRIRYVSVHEHPAYPGSGAFSRANIFNFPIPLVASYSHQLAAFRQSWTCVLEFAPELILVSAGFDSYTRDPLLSLGMHPEDFTLFGEWLAAAKIPSAAILEGGYSDDLPTLVDAFLSGWEPRQLLSAGGKTHDKDFPDDASPLG